MRRVLLTIYMALYVGIFIYADDCSSAMSEAKINYNNHLYKDAKSLFEYVVSEKDCERYKQEAIEWIAKCDQRLSEEKEKQERTELSVSRNNLSVDSSSGYAVETIEVPYGQEITIESVPYKIMEKTSGEDASH